MAKMSVDDSSLTAVANAIRTKGGTTDPLTFPDGFVSSVENLKVDSGQLIKYIEGTITDITPDMLAGCTKIRNDCFSNYGNIRNVTLPEGILSIGDRCFYNAGLESIVFPESIKMITYNSLALCKGLTTVVIPKNVTYLGGQAFYYCTSLQSIELKPTSPPSPANNVFKDCTALTRIIVPRGSLDAYKSATNWSNYADLMVEAEE